MFSPSERAFNAWMEEIARDLTWLTKLQAEAEPEPAPKKTKPKKSR